MDSSLAFCGCAARQVSSITVRSVLCREFHPWRVPARKSNVYQWSASASPEPKRPNRPPPFDSKSTDSNVGGRKESENSEPLAPPGSAGGPSQTNSALMQAMSDYFGDDGRELEEYMKHPRNAAGEIMLRVLLIGSGASEVSLARIIDKSDRARGLYYTPDSLEVNEEEHGLSGIAENCSVAAYNMETEIVKFCKWALVDVVFVGPDRQGCIGKESEADLAASGITVFPHDVSAAIVEGSLSVKECLKSLSEEIEERSQSNEQLVE